MLPCSLSSLFLAQELKKTSPFNSPELQKKEMTGR